MTGLSPELSTEVHNLVIEVVADGKRIAYWETTSEAQYPAADPKVDWYKARGRAACALRELAEQLENPQGAFRAAVEQP